MAEYKHIGIIADKDSKAQEARAALCERYALIDIEQGERDESNCDVVVALGGDGFMLHMLHRFLATGIAVYGMNRGTVGFLMNAYHEDDLLERLAAAQKTTINPLRMVAETADGERSEALAVNEVSLLRDTIQAAKIRISVDEIVHMKELVCDGVMVATPAGSSAYNFSTGGPILPLKSNLLALTPISAFRPRRWRGALLPHGVTVKFDVLKHKKRPVNAAADFNEVKNVTSVEIHEDRSKSIHLLFDPGHSLDERIIREQFVP